MKRAKQFGETVKGYKVPVLNEREIRASSGILFFFLFLSLLLILFEGKFFLVKYIITLFLVDFIIRIFVSPKYSPTLIIGRWIVSRQNPEYVGAAQKKFAWVIGLVLAATMFVLMVAANTYSPISGIICLICLIFLFFESSFGICLGCLFYGWFYKDKAQYCPGEVCNPKAKQDIQKISWLQFFMVLAFIAVLIVLALFYNDFLSQKPNNLFVVLDSLKHH